MYSQNISQDRHFYFTYPCPNCLYPNIRTQFIFHIIILNQKLHNLQTARRYFCTPTLPSRKPKNLSKIYTFVIHTTGLYSRNYYVGAEITCVSNKHTNKHTCCRYRKKVTHTQVAVWCRCMYFHALIQCVVLFPTAWSPKITRVSIYLS